MRLVSYQSNTGPRLGVVRGSDFAPIPDLDMLRLIEMGEAGLKLARAASGSLLPLNSIALLAPLPAPRRNIFCIGMNYVKHAKETAEARGREFKLPTHPVFFTKATTTVNGPYADIPIDPKISEQMDWETELAIVIGQPGKNIARQNALDYVFGYTVVNDVTARDMQDNHIQFFKGKSLDGACPMGPWIITRDEVKDPHALPIRCSVNGVVKQDSMTNDLIFDIPAIIEWLSKGMTLLPGDVIATGTPGGVGF